MPPFQDAWLHMNQHGLIGNFLRNVASRVRRQKHRVVIYTRRGCHLCEDAKQLMQRYGITPEMIDIDADQELRDRYDCCVPVVQIDGKIRFRGRVNEVLLRRFLSNTSGGTTDE